MAVVMGRVGPAAVRAAVATAAAMAVVTAVAMAVGREAVCRSKAGPHLLYELLATTHSRIPKKRTPLGRNNRWQIGDRQSGIMGYSPGYC